MRKMAAVLDQIDSPRIAGLVAVDTAAAKVPAAKGSDLKPGDVLRYGRYEIKRRLRSAREKHVYLAQDRVLGCQVAVDAFFNNTIMPGGVTLSAWETRVLGHLGDHPNIATVLDHWEDGETAFMVTRYLSGGSLRDRIERSRKSGGGLPAESILRIATEIAQGLSHIHSRRILYRDLQPRNVLFDEWGGVHLVDFDTAVSLDERDMSDLSGRPVIGYMAPELTDGGRADERADLYSLGATIYEMCEGHPPFAGTRAEILAARRAGPPPALGRDDLSQALRDLVLRLLAPECRQRPTSAADVVGRLESLRAAHAEIERLLISDETAALEFKSSLRTPVGPRHREDSPRHQVDRPGRKQDGPGRKQDSAQPGRIEHALEHEVLKTIAAFLNTDGGTLVIGVADDHSTVGIEVDYPRLNGSSDGWRLRFDYLVSHHLGTEVLNSIDLRLEPWSNRTIAIVRCSKREEPTWLDDEFFVRRTASTLKLSSRDVLAWWRERRH